MIRVGGVRRQGSFLPGALESATGNVAQHRREFRVVPPVLEEEVDEGVHVDARGHRACEVQFPLFGTDMEDVERRRFRHLFGHKSCFRRNLISG